MAEFIGLNDTRRRIFGDIRGVTRLIQSGTYILILDPDSICRKRIKNVWEDFFTIQGGVGCFLFSTVYDYMLGSVTDRLCETVNSYYK